MALKLNGTNSVAAPAYAGADADTGLQCGTDEVNLVTGGTARLKIDSSGKVGIGSTSPEFKLMVADAGYSAVEIKSDRTSASDNIGGLHFKTVSTSVAYIQSLVDGTLKFRNTSSLTERMRIDSSGQVGIGNTIPGSFQAGGRNLVVGDNSAEHGITIYSTTSGNLYFGDGTSGSEKAEGYIQYLHNTNRFDFGTSNSTRMTIDSSGNVGIGETSPDRKLHINSGTTDTALKVESTDSEVAIELADNAGSAYIAGGGNYVNFYVNGSERLRIDSSGRLGLGTTSPSSFNSAADDLVISNSGNCGITIDATSSTNSSVYFADGSTGSEAYRGYITYAHAADQFEFATAGTEQMRLDNNGSFYLNTSNDDRYAQTSGNGTFVWKTDDGSSGGSVIVSNDADNGWSAMYINKFDWSSGDDGRLINFFKNGVSLCNIELNSSGNVVYQTGSDYRLKENVVPMTNGITRLKQLLPKQFNMIDDPDDNLCDGFLAHEVQTVVPEAVSGTHNGTKTNEEGNEVPDYQGMDYGKLTPLLTAALQEAIGKIETLETQNADLLARVTALEAA